MIYIFIVVKALGCTGTSAMVNTIPRDQEAHMQAIINLSLHSIDRMD